MHNLKNKRLLVLGGTISTYEVVKTAKKLGVYVIVADYLEGGPAKELADECALISTTDIDGLCALIKEKQIDGVFTGASEFNIRNMLMVCEKAGLPSYITLEQWDRFSNKASYKDACREYGVPVVPEYTAYVESDRDNIVYPVIVKPVDSFSGHGISICRDASELDAAIAYAQENSKSKKYIVEKYVTGKNVEVYYLVQDGKVMLTTASDRYTNKEQNGSPVPVAFYHPTNYLDKYLEEVDQKVRHMFEAVGIKNGVFFMESFLADGQFMFYEMGLRLNATMEYHFVEYFNKFSPLEMMISYALTGSMGESVMEKNEPHLNGCACEVALLLNPGTVTEICGMKELEKASHVIHIIQFYHEGDSLTETGNLNQNFARIKVVAENEEELEARIEELYRSVSVIDENGNEMLIKEGRPVHND